MQDSETAFRYFAEHRGCSCRENSCRPPGHSPWPGQAPLPCSCGKEVDVSPYCVVLTLALFREMIETRQEMGMLIEDMSFHDKCFLHFFKKMKFCKLFLYKDV